MRRSQGQVGQVGRVGLVGRLGGLVGQVGFLLVAVATGLLAPSTVHAQRLTQRGFVEARGTWFPQTAPNDSRRGIGDLLAREELFVRATDWLRLAGGIDARANSYDQVELSWAVRFADRTTQRPALNVRRLSATVSRGGWTVDVGKQFIRWGKVDIVTPTDRFAPRDYLNVLDSEFLPVRGARVAWATEHDTLEAVVVPWFTPSRVPLLRQRWTPVPGDVILDDITPDDSLPDATQTGVRWAHVGSGYEYSLAVFNGFNHLPNVQVFGAPNAGATLGGPLVVLRGYPRMRMYGGDVAIPTRWVTIKGEAGYFTSSTPATDEFLLYVVQLERQTGEWLLIGGYAGSAVTESRGGSPFAPDRGTAKSFLGRASYTIDSTRSAAIEGAVRQNGNGVYLKGEYAKISGAHWRTTVAGALVRGEPTDFLGQFRRNSHLSLAFRYSF